MQAFRDTKAITCLKLKKRWREGNHWRNARARRSVKPPETRPVWDCNKRSTAVVNKLRKTDPGFSVLATILRTVFSFEWRSFPLAYYREKSRSEEHTSELQSPY